MGDSRIDTNGFAGIIIVTADEKHPKPQRSLRC